MTFKEKLLAVQQEIGVIHKDKANPFFKSRYADINSLLGQVKPVLDKHGLILTQALDGAFGNPAIRTKIEDVESDDSIVGVCPIPALDDPQKMGSAITYFRRYALQSMLALEAEDDDGNFASSKGKMPKINKDLPF